MSSFFRISQFLLEHGHNIIDLWFYRDKIYMLKIMSREYGHVFFLGIQNYPVTLSDEEYRRYLPSSSSKIYYLDDLDPSSSSSLPFSSLQTCLQEAIPEIRSDYILVHGCHLLTVWNSHLFHIQNLPESQRKGFYLYFSIEWLFEHRHVIHCEVHKLSTRYYTKLGLSIQQIAQHSSLSLQEKEIIHHLFQHQEKLLQKWTQWSLLFRQICRSENSFLRDLRHNENISMSDDLTFQETIRRGHQHRTLSEKVDKCTHLRKKIALQLLYSQQQLWSVILQFIFNIHRCTTLLQDLKSTLSQLQELTHLE